MKDQLSTWYREKGEYLTGAFFGLFVLNVFMFLIHCLSTGSADGYNTATLAITAGLFFVAWADRLYFSQEHTDDH